jgi:hypothetical protein
MIIETLLFGSLKLPEKCPEFADLPLRARKSHAAIQALLPI